MKKTVLAILLIICTMFSCLNTAYVYAEEGKSSKQGQSQQKAGKDKKDKDSKGKSEKKHSPHAKIMLVYDTKSGYIPYSKEGSKAINPYGLVKVLTAITAIENTKDLEKKISVPDNILKDYDYTYGNIGLASGESIAIYDLIAAMIMQDAGDCALALSHSIAKSQKDFIKLMNDTAKKAGATASDFTDPAGFNDSKQQTTLEDMAKITAYALKNESFEKIVSEPRLEIPPNNKSSYGRVMFSTNKFLSRFYSEDFYDARIKGVKGYYKDENDTGLIIRYVSGDDDLLILTAKSDEDEDENYAYKDTMYLIDRYKNYFTQKLLIDKEEFVSEYDIKSGKGTDRVLIISLGEIIARLPKDYNSELITREITLKDNLDAPIGKYAQIGEISVFYDGFKVGDAKLASYYEVERSIGKVIKNTAIDFICSSYFWIIALAVGLILYFNKKRKRNK